jgi:hypothetical protein
MTPRKYLAFFDFFELVMPDLGAASRKIGRSFRKIQKIPSKVCAMKRADMCIPAGLLFMRGVLPSFPFAVSVAISQKNLILALQKWKTHFLWDRTKIGLCGVPRCPKDHARIRYGLVSTIYAIIRAKPSLFDLKAMQLRTW